MGLPKITNELFYSTELPSEKTVEYRPWRVKEEKELLFAIEGQEGKITKDDILPHIMSLIQSCVKDVKVSDLSPVDIMALSIELFKKSKGEDIEIFYTCPHCNVSHSENPIFINLVKATTIKKFSKESVEIGKYEFHFKELGYEDHLRLIEKYIDSKSKYKFFLLVACLDLVIDDGEQYTHFTEKEAEEFFDKMNIKEFSTLKEKFDELYSDINIVKMVNCEACKKEVRVFINDVVDFFV